VRVLSDHRLAACSLAAQGLLVRVRDLSVDMPEPGCLRGLTPEVVCIRVAVLPSEGTPLLVELETHGLLSRAEDGALVVVGVSARQVAANRENGKRGGRPKKQRRGKPKTHLETHSETHLETHWVSEAIGDPKKRGGTELTRWWDTEYQRTRGVPFDWVQSVRKDGKLGGCPDAIMLANLAKQFDPEEIKVRITRYLESPSLFDAQTASPRMFQRAYATLAVQVRPLSKAQLASQETPESRALVELLRKVQ
jgi:hypothetical protein